MVCQEEAEWSSHSLSSTLGSMVGKSKPGVVSLIPATRVTHAEREKSTGTSNEESFMTRWITDINSMS